jgi:ATP-dependent helicase/DNAse subunit B
MIYLEVIRHMLAARYGLPVENVKPVGGIYYRLDARRVEAEIRALFVPNEVKNDLMQMRSLRSDPETVEDLVELVGTLFTKAVDYVEQIAQGEFRVTTHDVNIVCRGCEYHAVCRVGGGSVPASA